MNVWRRKVLVFFAGLLAILGLGIAYEKLVVPQQAVWDDEKNVHWDRSLIPLKVDGDAYPEALAEAVKLWNSQADCKLFAIDDDATITVRQGTIEVGAETEDWGAGAYVNRENTRGEIVVFSPLMVGTDLAVLHHELGHILGLAHDRSHTMKPIVEEEIGGRQKMVRAQDKDIDALNERYCKEQNHE
jgi:predicted Zn-dependent protease